LFTEHNAPKIKFRFTDKEAHPLAGPRAFKRAEFFSTYDVPMIAYVPVYKDRMELLNSIIDFAEQQFAEGMATLARDYAKVVKTCKEKVELLDEKTEKMEAKVIADFAKIDQYGQDQYDAGRRQGIEETLKMMNATSAGIAKTSYHDGYIQGINNGRKEGLGQSAETIEGQKNQIYNQVQIIEGLRKVNNDKNHTIDEMKAALNGYKGQCSKQEDEIVNLKAELSKYKKGLEAIKNIHAELRSEVVFQSPGVYVKDGDNITRKL